jgi:hypothetical protein
MTDRTEHNAQVVARGLQAAGGAIVWPEFTTIEGAVAISSEDTQAAKVTISGLNITVTLADGGSDACYVIAWGY